MGLRKHSLINPELNSKGKDKLMLDIDPAFLSSPNNRDRGK
jgi:hypothetical protein